MISRTLPHSFLYYYIFHVLYAWILQLLSFTPKKKLVPLSVNYHFTRECNFSCGFCFHTKLTDDRVLLRDAKRGLKMLKAAGMKKINFAGGEPFLYSRDLGEMVKYCKEELNLNVSIVSNGSKIKESWFEKYGEYLDILTISCDSFDEKTNFFIGRTNKSTLQEHMKGGQSVKAKEISDLCKQFNIKFKLNTVVNVHNWEEDMNAHIENLQPFRWKVFQVLKLEGENSGDNPTNRNVDDFLISSEQFKHFLNTHKDQKCLVPEDNEAMKDSYLILDEKMRFLNCQKNGKVPTESLLEVGVEKALQQSGFDEKMFVSRGGIYDWNKSNGGTPSDCSGCPNKSDNNNGGDKNMDW